MYLSSLHGYEHTTTLTHEKKFTREEFKDICDKVEKLSMGEELYYDEIEVERHLLRNEGFKRAVYQAGLFVD